MANKILIVDDAAFMRMMIKETLTKNGFEVCGEAENGAKALEKYKELSPDLVIMDITMPEVNGIEAAKGHEPETAGRTADDFAASGFTLGAGRKYARCGQYFALVQYF